MCHVSRLTREQLAFFEALSSHEQEIVVRELEYGESARTDRQAQAKFERVVKALDLGYTPVPQSEVALARKALLKSLEGAIPLTPVSR